MVGEVAVGGGAPISVQTMTKTDTTDIAATVAQIESVAAEGADIVRVAVPDEGSAHALAEIVARSQLPVIADIHFHPNLAIESIHAGAAGIRINPGNMPLEGLRATVEAAKAADIPIRIGLNSGSVRRRGAAAEGEFDVADLMVERALEYAEQFEGWGFSNIKISLKASSAATTIHAYREIAQLCDYPLHLGVTATGPYEYAVVKSAVGIGTLLSEGIGDTIRVSLSGPGEVEVRVGRKLLASLGLLRLPYEVISCPTCGRTSVDIVKLAGDLEAALRELGDHGGDTIRVAVMGCEVNGPGEARDADVGVACGKASALLFVKGEKVCKISPGEIIETLLAETRKLTEG